MPDQPSNDGYVFFAAPEGKGSLRLRGAADAAVTAVGLQMMWVEQQNIEPNQAMAGSIRGLIQGARLVVADATGGNANVMWEIGFAQALGIPTLLIAQDPGDISIEHDFVRVLTYHPASTDSNLFARLTDAIRATLNGDLGPAWTGQRSKGKPVFFSYSHNDSEYLDRILIHLRPVERSQAIDLWTDTKLKAGDLWRDEIKKAVDNARVAVLLVSADFLASDFIASNEDPPLLASAEGSGTTIIPVILKPSRFPRHKELSCYQAINDPKNPVISMDELARETLFANLAERIEQEIGFDS